MCLLSKRANTHLLPLPTCVGRRCPQVPKQERRPHAQPSQHRNARHTADGVGCVVDLAPALLLGLLWGA